MNERPGAILEYGRHWWGALVFVGATLVLFGGFSPVPESARGDDRTGQGSLTNSSVERRIDSILTLMTLEEKVGQLVQYGGNGSPANPLAAVPSEQLTLIKEGKVGSLLNVYGASVTRAIQKIAVEQSRMRIPLIFGLDVIHGFMTTFPIPLAEASSWDPEVAERSARIGAVEASASGIHWTFAPMVDIARDPRWGRIAEGSGEDPFLGSAMAAARVRGFQGMDLGAKGTIAACAKHFAAYGGAEGGRDYNTVDISERTLRETYLPPFHAAVDAGVATLMSSFNEIAGVPSTANHALLTDILRTEWGFKGFVVSDWNAVNELRLHGIAGSQREAAIEAINAGTDMDMVANAYHNELVGAVRAHRVSEQTLNESVRRILRIKFRMGLFDDPFRFCDPRSEKSLVGQLSHIQAARDVARKSIVLLKNENHLLPLEKKIGTLAVIGPLADDTREPHGPWAGPGNTTAAVSVLQGIHDAVPAGTNILFARGCAIEGDNTSGFDEAVGIAKRSDRIILVVGESANMSGEAGSRSSLDLPGKQEELVEAVVATGKPVILVLMNGRPLSIQWCADHVPAILEAWFLGSQSGHAIADVLFGDYSPSGKLPVSFPRTAGQIPIYYNHKSTGRPGSVTDHFTSKYRDLPLTPLYPFGFGLSYTTFGYSDLRIDVDTTGTEEKITVRVRVKNTGPMSGEEVVQLYVHDEVASITRPVKALKGFRKILLASGESQEVVVTLSSDALKFYDRSMRLVTEPGQFKVFVGGNSVDNLEGSFILVR